jgi:hypothetical protein
LIDYMLNRLAQIIKLIVYPEHIKPIWEKWEA